MEHFKLFLKGFVIGIGKILPGISGAMLAISFGVYEKIIKIISNFKTELRGNIKFVLLIGTGILSSIVLFGSVINFFLSNYFLSTMLLFLGLMCGTLPNLYKNVVNKKIDYKDLVLFITFLILIVAMAILRDNQISDINKSYFWVFIIGLIDAITMIIPGISGTAVFFMLGCYDVLLDIYSNIFNMNEILYTFLYGVGIVLGVYIFAKIMDYLFSKYRKNIYMLIFAFMISSITVLLYKTLILSFDFLEFIIGIALFIIGIKISLIFDN